MWMPEAYGNGAGFIDRDQVKLLVWFDNEEAAVAGPAIDNLPWVVRALQSLARQWQPQERQDVPPMPVPETPDFLDCTTKDLAVVIYKEHQVVVEKDEVFPGSGLASYYIDVAGRRRHDTEWAVARLDDLALSIEYGKGYDVEI